MFSWKTQSLTMKRIWIGLAFITAFILVHGTWTFRVNHQKAFAEAVEKKIDIDSIHVKAVSGVLILFGHGSKAQSDYAEDVARALIEKYAKRAINPPSTVRNEIEIGSVVTRSRKTAPKAASNRHVASVREPSKASHRN